MNQFLIAFAISGALFSNSALAAAQVTSSPNLLAPFQSLFLLIALLSRHRPIGGWLSYYYMTLYFSLLLTAILLPRTLQQLFAETFASVIDFVLAVVSTLLPMLVAVSEAAVATWLLKVRTASTLRLLRRLLALAIAVNALAMMINLFWFGDKAAALLELIQVGFAVLWFAYFVRSDRVRLVFVEGKWAVRLASVRSEWSPAARRYRGRRALMCALGGFAVAIIAIWAIGTDGGTVSELYFSPTAMLVAAVAALLGYVLPIAKARRDALAREQAVAGL